MHTHSLINLIYGVLQDKSDLRKDCTILQPLQHINCEPLRYQQTVNSSLHYKHTIHHHMAPSWVDKSNYMPVVDILCVKVTHSLM